MSLAFPAAFKMLICFRPRGSETSSLRSPLDLLHSQGCGTFDPIQGGLRPFELLPPFSCKNALLGWFFDKHKK